MLNPQNYFPHFGPVPALDSGELTTAEVLVKRLPGSKVVKALNSILVEDVVPDARPTGAKDRRALPMAGDDADAKAAVATFLDQIGYDSVDAGGLAETGSCLRNDWPRPPATASCQTVTGDSIAASEPDQSAPFGGVGGSYGVGLPRM